MNPPIFFIDDTDSLKMKKIIVFFISWTIRCADEKHQNRNKKVYNYAQRIVAKLLLFENTDRLTFSNIRLLKQNKNIDLWVELKVNKQEYALIIRNKMQSKIDRNLLKKYQKLVNKHYKNQPNRIIEYVILRPNHNLEKQDESLLMLSDFNLYSLIQLASSFDTNKTGNQLFDEFWFNWVLAR